MPPQPQPPHPQPPDFTATEPEVGIPSPVSPPMRFTRLPISGPPTGWGALPARVAAKPAGSARGLRFGIIDAAGEPEGPHAAAAALAFG